MGQDRGNEGGWISLGPDLEALDSPAWRAEMARAKPLSEAEINEWSQAHRQLPFSNKAQGGRLESRWAARWDAEGFGGPGVRMLCRDYGMAGRAAPDAVRVMGRLFARASLAMLAERDEGLGLKGPSWAFGYELRLLENPRAWAETVAKERARAQGRGQPGNGDRPRVELCDPESLVLALKEEWELGRSISRAPAQSRPGL